MSDTDFQPADAADLEVPSADAPFQRDEAAPEAATVTAKQAIKDGGGKLAAQATDRARLFADQGKAKAGETLDQFSQLLQDAAAQVDDKIGAQYGDYARTAAGQVTRFSDALKAKDVDELVEDVRSFVRASPGIAVGVAAAVGFAVSRVIQSGIDAGTETPKA